MNVLLAFAAENDLSGNIPDDSFSGGFGSTLGSVFQIIVMLAVFVIVLFLAYYATRLIGGVKFNKKGGNIDIIESKPIALNTSVMLIRAGEKYLLIGVTKDRLTLLSEIDAETVSQPQNTIQPIVPFERLLDKYLNREKK